MNDGSRRPRRETQLVLTGIVTVALVGFAVGLRGHQPAAPPPSAIHAHPDDGDVHRAVTYAEMRELNLGPNRDWPGGLDRMASPETDWTLDAADADARRTSLARRAATRAFNGAPPVVPHTIDQRSSAGCLACHADALRIGDRTASRLPHPHLANCTQCHAPASNPVLPRFTLASSGFVGVPAPFEGPRAWPGAPPVVPHSTLMRTDCLSCHGPRGLAGMRTTHPERTQCLQCHAPSATLDQVPTR